MLGAGSGCCCWRLLAQGCWPGAGLARAGDWGLDCTVDCDPPLPPPESSLVTLLRTAICIQRPRSQRGLAAAAPPAPVSLRRWELEDARSTALGFSTRPQHSAAAAQRSSRAAAAAASSVPPFLHAPCVRTHGRSACICKRGCGGAAAGAAGRDATSSQQGPVACRLD